MVADFLNLISIKKNAEEGRYAVVTKSVVAGSTLIEELPFVVGPKPNSPVVCLECCAPVDATANGPRCQHCHWPLCDDCKLNSSRAFHSKECEVFVQNKVKFQNLTSATQLCLQLDFITPLRLLLQKEANPDRWEKEVSNMASHDDKRVNTPIWQADKVNIVGYLHGPCKLKERFPEDLILKACGILEVNAFEGKTRKGHKVRCIYPIVSIISHSCVPNTTHSIIPSKDFKIIVRATVDVKEKEKLFTTYTYTMNGTAARQEHLKNGKFFTCKCPRCVDPTELQTNFSSLLCQKCNGGVIVSSNPLDPTSEWNCLKCSFKTPSSAIETVISTIESEINALQDLETSLENIKLCENVLKKFNKVLHPNHFLMINLKENLVDMYGWQLSDKIENEFINAECLERKIQLGRDVLNVLNVLQPGLNRARAMVMYELYTSMGAILKKNWDSLPNRSQFVDEAKKLFNECLKIFEWEDENSLEHYLADICKKIADEIQFSQQFQLDLD